MTKQKSKYIITLLCYMIMCVFAMLQQPFHARAAMEYTDVMTDLSTDDTFSPDEYKQNPLGFTLDVIQIAESSDKELFLYVYNPSAATKPLTATSVRISTGINDNFSPEDYTLTKLSMSGVFCKYIVNGFKVKPDPLRYYDIVCLHRSWDKTIDPGTGNDNTISEVPCEVGKLYTASTVDGKTTYSCKTTETVNVTDKYCGTILYSDGFKPSWTSASYEYTASHYVAFSTDRGMDSLLEADVEYSTQSVTGVLYWPYNGEYENTYGAVTPQPKITLYDDDTTENKGDGWWGKKRTWKRIQSASSFTSSEDLTSEAKDLLATKQWVLRFRETEYRKEVQTTDKIYRYSTRVSDVTVLRLKFEADGKVYNLGVVDNKQTGNKISNVVEALGLPLWAWILIGIGAVLIVLPVLGLIFRPVATILKGVLYVLSLPFRGIAALVRKIKDGRSG